jgi:hypothetical protein
MAMTSIGRQNDCHQSPAKRNPCWLKGNKIPPALEAAKKIGLALKGLFENRCLQDDHAVGGSELVFMLLVGFRLIQPLVLVDQVFEFVLAFFWKRNFSAESAVFFLAHGDEGLPIAVQTRNGYCFCIFRLHGKFHLAVIFGFEVCLLNHLMDNFAC